MMKTSILPINDSRDAEKAVYARRMKLYFVSPVCRVSMTLLQRRCIARILLKPLSIFSEWCDSPGYK